MCKPGKWLVRHPNHDEHKSTGHMKRHFLRCQKYIHSKRNSEGSSNLNQLPSILQNNRQTRIATSEDLEERVLQIIIAGNLSFAQAENPRLRDLVREGWPNLNMPNRHSIALRLKKEAQLIRDALQCRFDDVDSKVSLSLDGWSARIGHMSFIGISPM